ncbi:molybdopterin molybdotransferase MoeA [Cryobacterium arcticum]|uniref:Molybdopterin molybdenumtransferase n=1 Tax=Cryobacterium arcticum TaxID=670052 RepID=A0A1B1BHN7_9MICO|nr:molybdopterin molybdotransferase MoeA [Cryobacterium arcticum]ANP72060.1 molybdopterin molybdenumtransferase MoeA [Cryobacterium arcticum]
MEWLEARSTVHTLGGQVPRTTEVLPLADAVGRTLAAAVHSLTALPSFASSAMDGWAVNGDGPWALGTPILAGDPPADTPLAPGTARPIATGGCVPAGTHGILRSEHGLVGPSVAGGPATLTRLPQAGAGEPAAGEHVRARGEECGLDERMLEPGCLLTAPRVALAAVTGHDTLTVTALPDVELLLLGTEVIESGIPGPGQVRDAYSPEFPALLTGLGLRVRALRRLPDDLGQTVEAIRSSTAALVISTGGSARGPADHVRAALAALGATVLIDGVRMRPGHPVMLARLVDGRLMLCLPGNPLAAMLVLVSLGMPLIDGMLGRPLAGLGRVALAHDIANLSGSTRLVAYRNTDEGAVPTARQGSGMLRGLAEADGVAVVPPGGACAPNQVATLPLPW